MSKENLKYTPEITSAEAQEKIATTKCTRESLAQFFMKDLEAQAKDRFPDLKRYDFA